MKHLEATLTNIIHAAQILRDGGLVAFPTETVYGLGADGFNEIAVSKIFEAKKRPSFNPLIMHISTIDMLDQISSHSSEKVKALTEKFWPGPLTLILKRKEIVPYIVTSGLETVAVRMPDNKIALELINQLGNPIAAPSANEFSRLSPTKADHVIDQLGNKVDLVLDGGKCDVGVESTIVEVTEESQFLLRPGGIAEEEIEKIIGKLSTIEKKDVKPSSPGQLKVHYAPDTPINYYAESDLELYSKKNVGAIFFNKIKNDHYFRHTRVLTKNDNLREAASNLFSFLHEIDSYDLDLIVVEPIKEVGLGIAIMDRLNRAVNKFL